MLEQTLLSLATLVCLLVTPVFGGYMCAAPGYPNCKMPICTTENTIFLCPIYYVNTTQCFSKNVSFTTTDHLIANGTQVPICTMNGYESSSCQTNCLLPPSLQNPKCNGTSTYCSLYNCTGGNGCFCNMFNVTQNVTLQKTDQYPPTPYPWLNTTYVPCGFWMNYTQVTPGNRKRDLVSNLITVTFTNPTVSVNNPNSLVMNVLVQKDALSGLTTSNSTLFQYTIADQYLVASGYIYVDVYVAGVLTSATSYYFTGTTTCRLSNCLFCADALTNFACVPGQYQAIVIVILVLLAIIALTFIPPLLYGVWMLVMCFFQPTKWICCVLWGFWSKKIKMKERLMNMKEKADSYTSEDAEPKKPARQTRQARRMADNLPNPNIVILCLIFFVGRVSSLCVNGGVLSSTVQNCVVGGSTCAVGSGQLCKTCNLSTTLQTTIPLVGASTCYSLIDAVTGSSYGSLEIKYNYMIETVVLSKMYYTSAWTLSSQYNQRCYNPSQAPCTGNSCANLVNIGDRTAYGQITSTQVLNYPGTTICQAGCGCAACGCGLCVSSCLFSGFGIIPVGDVYEVYQLTTVQFTPSVTVNYTDAFGVSTVVTTTIVGVSQTVANFTFITLGTYQSNLNLFGTNNVFRDTSNGNAYYGPTSNTNANVAGSVGDIQSNTLAGLSTAITPTSFTYPVGAVSEVSIDGVSVQYSATQIASIPRAGTALPAVLGGSLWQMYNNNLQGNITNPGALVVQISTFGTFLVSVSTAAVCPVFNVVAISGCFSCLTGVVAVISAKSTCYGGSASVTTTSTTVTVDTPIIVLDTVYQNFSVYLSTPDAANAFNITLTASTSATVAVQFTAVDINNVVGTNTTTSLNGTNTSLPWFGNASDFFINLGDAITGFFDDVFQGIASWWEYPLMVIVLGGLIALSVVVGYYSIRAYRRMKAKKDYKPMKQS